MQNIYLTKYGQKIDLWIFCDHDKGIGWSQQAIEILKIELFIFLFFYKNENPKNLKIDYISAACRVNLPRSSVYFWTLVCS
jgi:hypothetical protein